MAVKIEINPIKMWLFGNAPKLEKEKTKEFRYGKKIKQSN